MNTNIERLKSVMAEQYKGCTISQSDLRLERNIQSLTTTQINFAVLDNDNTYGSVSSMEIRLKTTDVFVATMCGVYIYKAGTTTSASDTDRSKARLQTSPNPGTFSAANEADNLMAIYNGFLTFAVNRKVYFPALPVMRCYRVGDVQAGLITATGGVTTQQSNWPEANYGGIGLNPSFTFGGQSQNTFGLTMPAANSFAGTNSTNFLVLIFRGLLIQGAALQFENEQRQNGFTGQ